MRLISNLFLSVLMICSTAYAQTLTSNNSNFQQFIASIKKGITLQDLPLMGDPIQTISKEYGGTIYVYEIEGCLVKISVASSSSHAKRVSYISIPGNEKACAFNIAPFFDIPTSDYVSTYNLTFGELEKYLNPKIEDYKTMHFDDISPDEEFKFVRGWINNSIWMYAGYTTSGDSFFMQKYAEYMKQYRGGESHR